MITEEVKNEALVVEEVSKDISANRAAMAPIKMDCEWTDCQYATKEYEPAVAVEILKLHCTQVHQTQVTGGSTAGDSRRSGKHSSRDGKNTRSR